MKTRILEFVLAASVAFGLFAQETSELGISDSVKAEPSVSGENDSDETERFIVFFGDSVPRYKGFALGANFINQYALGDWADFAKASIGLGVDVEFTLPIYLPKNLDVGVSGRFDWMHTFPKSDSTLKRNDDFRFTGGAWLRVPFLLGGQRFALQPEVAYGLALHNGEGKNGSEASGLYGDSMLSFALGLRYIAPVASLENVEFELAPLYTLSAEDDGYSMSNLGFRLGAVWHIQSFVNQKKAEKETKEKATIDEQQRLERKQQEEERKKAEIERLKKEAEQAAADEAERARIAAEEARRAEIAAWPNPLLAFTASPQNFTPDGDGVDDTVTFTMGVQYLEETPESWAIAITDPQGNAFRTIKGRGALPESVEWDGKSDKGEVVASKNVYKAVLTVTPSRTDRLRTGELTATTDLTISTGLLLEVIVPEHEWKMVVNAMQFAGGGATFDGLDEATLAANNKILDEVAAQITARPGASVFVQGYANNVSGTEKENREELIPLSQERADFVVEELVKRGIDRESLTAEGKGGANPIASRRDRANWWKNRRIEFVIKK